jgi:hypothetical protein
MDGRNTFGCFVNSKIFHPKAPGLGQASVYAEYVPNHFLTIGSTSETGSFFLVIFTPIKTTYTYALQDTSIAKSYYVDKNASICTYEDYNVLQGEIIISRFDLEKRIVSGTFDFTTYNPACGDTIKVTDGRFDIGELTY